MTPLWVMVTVQISSMYLCFPTPRGHEGFAGAYASAFVERCVIAISLSVLGHDLPGLMPRPSLSVLQYC